MAKVLILDRSKSMRNTLRERLEYEGFTTEIAENEQAARSICSKIPFDLLLTDTAAVPTDDLPFIVITERGSIDSAIEAVRGGAEDYLTRPIDMNRLLQSIHRTIDREEPADETAARAARPATRRARRSAATARAEAIIGTSPEIVHVRELIDKVAPCEARVLITGENGTGKEMLAREIHRLSTRRGGTMVSLDPGAIPDTLFESELFGHVKGAFTDARTDRAGKFETASGGTLFLDEIGNLPLHMQAKLLTVLQNRSIVRLGSNTPVPVDIRLITATNRDLFDLTAQGGFRQDLLYRINTIHIVLPPLRSRKEDIAPLAAMFLARYAEKYGKRVAGFTSAASERLAAHAWEGNIRELQHTVEKAVIMSDAEIIDAAQLLLRPATAVAADNEMSTLEQMERRMIRDAIAACNGNMTAVAQQLGITRQTLYNKIKRYGL